MFICVYFKPHFVPRKETFSEEYKLFMNKPEQGFRHLLVFSKLREFKRKRKKNVFCVLNKLYVLQKKTIVETIDKVGKYYGDSAASVSLVNSGLLNFVVIATF